MGATHGSSVVDEIHPSLGLITGGLGAKGFELVLNQTKSNIASNLNLVTLMRKESLEVLELIFAPNGSKSASVGARTTLCFKDIVFFPALGFPLYVLVEKLAIAGAFLNESQMVLNEWCGFLALATLLLYCLMLRAVISENSS